MSLFAGKISKIAVSVNLESGASPRVRDLAQEIAMEFQIDPSAMEYEKAVDEMIVKTSTPKAPWIIVSGNDKLYARVQVLRAVVEAVEARIKEMEKE